MAWSITLGTIYGTKVRVHFTMLIFLLWIGIGYWIGGGPAAALSGLGFIVLLFACVLAHEFGHILTARRFGVRTPDVTLLPIGGVARLERIPEQPAQELAVSLAGPVVNLVIAGLLVAAVGMPAFEKGLSATLEASAILPRLAIANLILAVFNLLPAFPMDGGRALRALLATRLERTRATRLAATIGQSLAFGFALIGLLSGNPILVFIGLFVYFGASAEAYETQMQQIAEGLLVSEAMMTELVSLTPDNRLDDAVDMLLRTSQHEFPVVDGAGKLIGLLTRDRLVSALRTHGGSLPVIEAMEVDIPAIGTRHRLAEALREMQARRAPAVAAVHPDGRLAGLVTTENLGELMMVVAARGKSGISGRQGERPASATA
ncbi:MAG: site-2 protease family protein [Sphingomonadales bacterium]